DCVLRATPVLLPQPGRTNRAVPGPSGVSRRARWRRQDARRRRVDRGPDPVDRVGVAVDAEGRLAGVGLPDQDRRGMGGPQRWATTGIRQRGFRFLAPLSCGDESGTVAPW